MPSPEPNFLGILQVLRECEVEFVIVGGVCAAFHGAPIATFDLEIVHSRNPDNISRLLRAFGDLDAFFAEHSQKKLRPQEGHLDLDGPLLLMTRLGPLDVMGTVGKALRYEDLLAQTNVLNLEAGLSVRVLSLDLLIETKEQAGRDQDLAHLAVLKKLQDEKGRRK